MITPPRALPVLLLVVLGACAHGGGLGELATADSDSGSEGSSEGSDGSSQGTDDSGASSQDSGNSSQDSGNSSQDSGNSSNESSGEESTNQSSGEESTEQSSADTTQNSTDGTSSRGEEQAFAGPVLTTAGVLITGAAVGLIFWLDRDVVAPDRAEVTGEVTRRWLVANSHQLAVDLALGAGPALDDLAGAAGIAAADRVAFGKALRAHRSELLALADPSGLNHTRALAFLERMGEIARDEPALTYAYRAFVERDADDAATP